MSKSLGEEYKARECQMKEHICTSVVLRITWLQITLVCHKLLGQYVGHT